DMVNTVRCVFNPSSDNFVAGRDGYEEHRLGLSATRRARTIPLGGTLGEHLARRPRAGSSAWNRSPLARVQLLVFRRSGSERHLSAFRTQFGRKHKLRGLLRATFWRP